MAIISVENVKKDYPLGKTIVQAVKGVSFDIQKGDFISIAGPSGSGKTTMSYDRFKDRAEKFIGAPL